MEDCQASSKSFYLDSDSISPFLLLQNQRTQVLSVNFYTNTAF